MNYHRRRALYTSCLWCVLTGVWWSRRSPLIWQTSVLVCRATLALSISTAPFLWSASLSWTTSSSVTSITCDTCVTPHASPTGPYEIRCALHTQSVPDWPAPSLCLMRWPSVTVCPLQVKLLKDTLDAWKREVEKKPPSMSVDDAYEVLNLPKGQGQWVRHAHLFSTLFLHLFYLYLLYVSLEHKSSHK